MLNIEKSLLGKDDNKISQFYNNNPYITYKSNNNYDMKILTYNVHCWRNINSEINNFENVNFIKNMVKDIDPDIIIFQEVTRIKKKKIKTIVNNYYKLGYTSHVMVPNGNETNVRFNYIFVLVISKYTLDSICNLDITVYNTVRNCCIFTVKGLKICAIHLEIGDYTHNIPDINEKNKIIKLNSDLRINQLSNIILNNPDIIIGDFNFTQNDIEYQYLLDNEYKYYGNIDNSTPFNRVDMIFIKNNNLTCCADIIQCNYSDHLPLLCGINNKN